MSFSHIVKGKERLSNDVGGERNQREREAFFNSHEILASTYALWCRLASTEGRDNLCFHLHEENISKLCKKKTNKHPQATSGMQKIRKRKKKATLFCRKMQTWNGMFPNLKLWKLYEESNSIITPWCAGCESFSESYGSLKQRKNFSPYWLEWIFDK